MLKEVGLEEITKYKDPFALFEESAIALAMDPTLGENGHRAAITIAWGALGILFGDPTLTVYIHKSRYSEQVFEHADTFSVCFFDTEHQQEINAYYVAKSSRDIDKYNEGVFTPLEIDGTPAFKEAKLVIVCKKVATAKFDSDHVYHNDRIKNWYASSGGHTLFVGRIQKILREE
ncbi:MAG: flavin reductase [Bacilli bacterium]|nr:flavin reductase [Bacilli bacterium]